MQEVTMNELRNCRGYGKGFHVYVRSQEKRAQNRFDLSFLRTELRHRLGCSWSGGQNLKRKPMNWGLCWLMLPEPRSKLQPH